MMPNQSTILRRLCCLHARMLLAVLPLFLVGCGVHEFPDVPDTAKVCLHLRFDTDMPQVYYTLSRTGAPVQVTSVRKPLRPRQSPSASTSCGATSARAMMPI